jgi:hypothetical protein
VHRAAWRQVFRNRPPLASRAQNIHDPVHHFAHIDVALVAAPPSRWDQRFNKRPFIICQIARVSQIAAVVTSTVLHRPHTLPLALFGSERYATLMGRLAFPSLIVQALAPSAAALLIEYRGVDATMAAMTAFAVLNVIFIVVLWGLCSRAVRG